MRSYWRQLTASSTGARLLNMLRKGCLAGALAIIVIAFCTAYIRVENPIYAWDLGGYWHVFQSYGDAAARGDWSWPHRILASARADDYNATPVVPLLPVYLLFGGSRTAYVTAVSVLYLLPTVAITASIARMALADRRVLPLWTILLLGLVFIPFWRPTIRGYLDIVGLLGLSGATWLLLRSEFLQIKTVRTALAIGVCLWSAFLFRRWYAFSIVAFFGAAVIVGGALAFFAGRAELRKRFVHLFGGLFVAGLVLVALVLAFQAQLAIRVLSTSYADIYDAYQVPLGEHLSTLVGWLTPAGLMAAALGVGAAISVRNGKVLFCALAAAFTYVMFIRTQRFGDHHFLPVAMWSFVLIVSGLNEAMRLLTARFRRGAAFALSVGAVALFALVTVPSSIVVPPLAAVVVSRPDLKPLKLPEFERYATFAAQFEASLRPGDRAAIFASSRRISDSLLAEIRPSLASRIAYIDHVDKFHMFTFDLLRVNVALAVSPDQTHLPPESQLTVTVPGHLLLRQEGFGRAFALERSYDLPGVKVSQFRRIRDATADEAAELLSIFAERYPSWPAAYQKSIAIPFALRTVSPKAPWGHGSVILPNTLMLHPEPDGPTSVTIPFDSRLGAVPAAVELRRGYTSSPVCGLADGVAVTIEAAGKLLWQGEVLSTEPQRVTLPPELASLAITIDRRGNDACDLTYATFDLARK